MQTGKQLSCGERKKADKTPHPSLHEKLACFISGLVMVQMRLFLFVCLLFIHIMCCVLSRTDPLQKFVASLVTQVRPHKFQVTVKCSSVVLWKGQQTKYVLCCVSRRNKRLHESQEAQKSAGEQPSSCVYWPWNFGQSDSSDGGFPAVTLCTGY